MLIEEKILFNFKKKMKDEVKDLDLFVALAEDTFPDEDGVYSCQVMERQDNGKVWDVICTKSGNIKDVYQL